MAIRIIATDLDGTLLGHDHKVSPDNARALKRAEDAGIMVVLASGRAFFSVREFARGIGLQSPIISSNGSRVQLADGTIIAEQCLAPESARTLIELYDSMNLFYELYSDDTIYLSLIRDNNPSAEAKLAGSKATNFIYDPEAMRSRGVLRAHKIVVFDQDFDKIDRLKDSVRLIPGLELNSSWRDNIEAMRVGIDKGWAMRKLMDYFNVSPDEAMAFGDNLNDKAMLEACAWPVAMLNATDDLKAVSRVIAPDCNDSGVAHVVNEYVLSKLPARESQK